MNGGLELIEYRLRYIYGCTPQETLSLINRLRVLVATPKGKLMTLFDIQEATLLAQSTISKTLKLPGLYEKFRKHRTIYYRRLI